MTQTRIVSSIGERAEARLNWECQYLDGLAGSGTLSREARDEIERTLARVFEHIPAPDHAPPRHRVCGALVGAIQSGKTGVMVGLAARALDRGFRTIVVLAGLRDDLRMQTALRFVTDLLQRGDEIFSVDGEKQFTHSLGGGYHGVMRDGCWAPHFAEDVNHDEAFTSMLARRLRGGHSALIVAKKNLATLNRLRDAVAYVGRQCQPGDLPMFVIDDECDEASVSGTDDAPTPERICGVWKDIDQYVAYAGFTATPAANLLQDPDAALFPRDFVEVLRMPGEEHSALEIVEPAPDRRYTGGGFFYRFLESYDRDNFLVRARMSDAEFHGAEDQELEEAVIAYFVSGAIRLASYPGCSLRDREKFPRPHTMLAHTEAEVQGHWDLCRRIVSLARRHGGQDGVVKENLRRVRPSQRLSARDLCVWLSADEKRWEAWYNEFLSSRRTLLELRPDHVRPEFPGWVTVKDRLPEVFEQTQLRVINSDESASDPPLSFRPAYASGAQRPPTDTYSIVIGGNRLSRGLTIEGLCISYYTRSSAVFAEDSTVQRERWFGYRGGHLEYCRLFTHRDLAIRLARFHEHDEDLRRQLAWNVRSRRPPSDATFRFLRLQNSRPTAKLGRGQEDSLEIAGARLFFGRVQMGETALERVAAQWNQDKALACARRLTQDGQPVNDARGTCIAYLRGGIPALEVATLLDSYRFTFHNPDPASGVQINVREWYRPRCAELPDAEGGFPPRSDPYLLAAYLRFWSHAYESCQTRPIKNPFRGSDGVSKWVPVPPPSFNLVLRVGTLDPAAGSPFEHRLLNRSISANGEIGSRWGGHGYTSYGDEWIDAEPPGGDKSAPRLVGMPGLALLHVISRAARGLSGAGIEYCFDRPTFGVVVPEGGPCIHFVLASP